MGRTGASKEKPAEGVAPPSMGGLVLWADVAAGGELDVAGREGAFVIAIGAAQVSGRLDATAEGAMSGSAGVESEFVDGAVGMTELVGAAVLVVGAVVAGASASGGVEDLGLSPAEGDGAMTSSTGLFYREPEEV